MKHYSLTRRAALGSSLIFGSSLALAQPWQLLQLLQGPDALDKIKGYIALGLDYHIQDKEFLKSFYQSLLIGIEHSRSGLDFQQLLATKHQEDALAIYVIQEFVVYSNYYEVASGRADKLSVMEVEA